MYSTKPVAYVIFAIASLVLLLILGAMESEDLDNQQDQYSEMVCLWIADAEAGYRKEDRRGWPNYKGLEISCDQK